MFRSALVGLVVVLLIAKAATGLRVVWSNSAERTDRVSFAPQPKNYEVRGDNGSIEFDGNSDASANVEVTSVCQASAHDEQAAAAALEAMEVTIDGRDKETCRIGWHWKTPPHADWSGAVRFQVVAPQHVNLRCEAQNGAVTVHKLSGDARLKSQNGRIVSETSGDTLEATTENGTIDSKFAGRHLHLHTSNGTIAADLSRAVAVDGEIGTQNGTVTLAVGDHTSCKLSASTVNGRVSGAAHKKGWKNKWSRNRSVDETFGEGGGPLKVTVQNGAIHIRHVTHDEDSDKDNDGDESDD
jgi:hypothetical protein